MSKNSRETFVKQLKKYMTIKKKSQKDISNELGIPTTTVSNWYLGKKYPRPDSMQKLADYFGIKMEELISDNSTIKTGVKIPVLGTVIAGIPITAIEEILDYEEISESLAKTGDFYALKIKGTSMEPKMSEGDIVIVRQQNYVENNQIAIVLINGDEATVKQVRYRNDGIELIGFNSYVYPPTFYTKEQILNLPIQIIGKVVELRAKF